MPPAPEVRKRDAEVRLPEVLGHLDAEERRHALDDVDAASKGFEEHGFEDATDSNLHYHYENVERSKIGDYILISADQYITTDDGETEDEPRKTINFVVSDGNGSGRAFYVIIRGFTQEYRDAVMDEIKLVNE